LALADGLDGSRRTRAHERGRRAVDESVDLALDRRRVAAGRASTLVLICACADPRNPSRKDSTKTAFIAHLFDMAFFGDCYFRAAHRDGGSDLRTARELTGSHRRQVPQRFNQSGKVDAEFTRGYASEQEA
jgi:hypothetical protein